MKSDIVKRCLQSWSFKNDHADGILLANARSICNYDAEDLAGSHMPPLWAQEWRVMSELFILAATTLTGTDDGNSVNVFNRQRISNAGTGT